MDLAILEQEAWYLLRIVVAVVLGFFIGWERKKRFKEASLRTHAIVSLGSALIMVISKYGFSDLGTGFDGARLAAQVVSGIGFIGAGMIMYRKRAIHNLTTAAGVWATAGVGMAVGAGQYLIGVGATVLIVAIQYILHLPINSFKTKNYFQYKIVFYNTPDALGKVKSLFTVTKFTKVNVTRAGEDLICTAYLTTDLIYKSEYLSEIMEENSFITSVERVDDD